MGLDRNNLAIRNKFPKGFWMHQSCRNQWQLRNEILQVLSLTVLNKPKDSDDLCLDSLNVT